MFIFFKGTQVNYFSASEISFLSPYVRIQIQFECVGFNISLLNKRQNLIAQKTPVCTLTKNLFVKPSEKKGNLYLFYSSMGEEKDKPFCRHHTI